MPATSGAALDRSLTEAMTQEKSYAPLGCHAVPTPRVNETRASASMKKMMVVAPGVKESPRPLPALISRSRQPGVFHSHEHIIKADTTGCRAWQMGQLGKASRGSRRCGLSGNTAPPFRPCHHMAYAGCVIPVPYLRGEAGLEPSPGCSDGNFLNTAQVPVYDEDAMQVL